MSMQEALNQSGAIAPPVPGEVQAAISKTTAILQQLGDITSRMVTLRDRLLGCPETPTTEVPPFPSHPGDFGELTNLNAQSTEKAQTIASILTDLERI